MENVGTWNSDYAILFFGALIAPFFLYFLGRFFSDFVFVEKPITQRQRPPKKEQEEWSGSQITIKFEEAITRHKKHCPQYDPDLPPPSQTPRRTTISKDGGKTWKESKRFHSNCGQDKSSTGTKPKKTISKPKKASQLNDIQSDAVGALCSLGVKKTQAKNLVLSLCEKKDYNSLDSLIHDCLKKD